MMGKADFLLRGRVLAVLLPAILLAGCGGGSETETASHPFAPQATLSAVGGTVRTDNPQLVMRVKTRPGDANIRSVSVELPPVVLVDATSIKSLCSESQLRSKRCAGSQRLGVARVQSPAYKGAVSGPVYAVSGPKGFHLVYVLSSGSTNFLLEGKVGSKGGRMQAGVEDVPDVPLKTFELRIDGGKSGYLVLDRNICGKTAIAEGTFTSQEGLVHKQEIPLKADCAS